MTRILDVDRHVMEPMSLWADYLPADLRARMPYLVDARPEGSFEQRVAKYGAKAMFPLRPTLMYDGEPAWSQLSQAAQVELSWSAYQRRADAAATSHPEGQLASMTRVGIHAAFLYPSLSLYLLGMTTLRPGDGAVLAAAYNDWLRAYCSHDPRRLRGVGLLSTHDPESMAAEAARVAGFGWTAVSLLPNQVQGRGLSDPAYDALWATCERLSLAVAIHAATHTRLPAVGAGRFSSHFALHACAHPMEQMMAFLALVEGGVLERHPRLRVGFFESGCGWVPYWLHRLDEVEYAHYADEVRDTVKRKPSEYFRRQCFVVIEPDEPYLPAIVNHLGADNLLFGTDYPHGDHGDDMVDKALRLKAVLPDDVLHKILWDNPARFYGLSDEMTV